MIAEVLYHSYPSQPEGVLTRLRASLVNRKTLAGLARAISLGDHLRLGPGERRSGGWRRESILANSLEALIGAVYLDSGISACQDFVLSLYQPMLSELTLDDLPKDPKTRLQEYLQAHKQQLPEYRIAATEGEAHDRVFTVECRLTAVGETVIAQGKSRRAAEQSAAEMALKLLQQ